MILRSSPGHFVKKAITFAIFGICTFGLSAQQFWTPSQAPKSFNAEKRYIIPQEYRNVRIDKASLQAQLEDAPLHSSEPIRNSSLVISFPMPDGTTQRFAVVEDPIMSPILSEKFPEIKTYSGQGLDDRTATIKFDVTHKNIHAMVLSVHGTVFIDPFTLDSTNDYISYYKKDYINHDKIFNELAPIDERVDEENDIEQNSALVTSGTELRTYRLAVATTVEYSNFHGGVLEDVMAAVVTSINRVSGIYEKEVAISFELVDDNDQIIFIDEDDLSNSNPGTLIGQSQETIDEIIGFDNYDVGHTFSTGAGGLASLRVPCTNSKARGVTGTNSPVGDPFDVDYVAHEIGHQFGATHTFNGSVGSCNGNRTGFTAFEPGSGSTIMAYAGICSSHNIQNNSDPYFHTGSFDQITDYSVDDDGNDCAVITDTNNNPPEVSVPVQEYYIPLLTPFRLEGSATDSDGDALTYCWEQVNTGPAGNPDAPTGNAAIFRSFSPTETPERIFPRMEDILNNDQTKGEILVDYDRTLKFRLTVRDNRAGGGGVSSANYEVEVYDIAGPFEVLYPHPGAGWQKGSTQTVTWDVSNTDGSLVNCQSVNILLSLDGGENFDMVLAEDVPNNGAADITVPTVDTTDEARLMIEAADNIFFDVSNGNFHINDTGLGIEAVFNNNDISLYPNPANDELALTIELNKQQNAEIIVIDAIGKTVMISDVNQLSEGNNRIRLNIESLKTGIYFVKMNIEGQQVTKRFSKI